MTIYIVTTNLCEPMESRFYEDVAHAEAQRQRFDDEYPYSAPHIVQTYDLRPTAARTKRGQNV